MQHIIKLFITLLLMALSPLILAQNSDGCPRPDTFSMDLQGDSATETEFMEIQSEVQAYADAATLYLECLQQMAASTPEEEQQDLVSKYNEVATEMQGTLNAYNSQVRIYTARMASIESADDCSRPDAIEVGMDGNSSSESEMMGAQSAVRDYVNTANAYLECLQLAAQVVEPEEQDILVDLYNDMTNELQATVADFNAQVRAFRARAEEAAADGAQ